MTDDSTAIPDLKINRQKKIFVAMAVLCLLGVGVSTELTRIHFLTHTDPSFHSVCAVSDGLNCETVALSPYSVFAGLPISVWGIIGYTIMGLLAIWSATGVRNRPPWVHGGLVSLSAFSLAVSIALLSISLLRIDSVCLFCLASYCTNFVLFILCTISLLRSPTGIAAFFLQSIRSFFKSPVTVLCVLLTVGVVVAMVEILVTPYWECPGWRDLPSLNRGIDKEGHHWVGAENPLVSIVEFSDYECPHCRKAHKKVRMIAAEYPEAVRLYHRHLPLDKSCHPKMKREFHRYACHFAKAAECAGRQAGFWEMNDALFSIQDEIKSKDVDVEKLAVEIGLDRSVFKKCMVGNKVVSRIDDDLNSSMEKGLHGTPTFFIEDKEIPIQLIKARLVEALRVSKRKMNTES
jgi:uncharacterized membrane protein/predicted DsbA family dithiol-disulfide isomerase